jgi:hypothetical protein
MIGVQVVQLFHVSVALHHTNTFLLNKANLDRSCLIINLDCIFVHSISHDNKSSMTDVNANSAANAAINGKVEVCYM